MFYSRELEYYRILQNTTVKLYRIEYYSKVRDNRILQNTTEYYRIPNIYKDMFYRILQNTTEYYSKVIQNRILQWRETD